MRLAGLKLELDWTYSHIEVDYYLMHIHITSKLMVSLFGDVGERWEVVMSVLRVQESFSEAVSCPVL